MHFFVSEVRMHKKSWTEQLDLVEVEFTATYIG